MKPFFTFLIAVCLFALCLLEKEAKIQAREAQQIKQQISANQRVQNSLTSGSMQAKAPKSRLLPSRFQLAEFATSDSIVNSLSTSGSL
jgi:hypothetical protein